MDLASKHCEPCEGGVPKKTPKEADALLADLAEWGRDGDWIQRDYTLKDFMACVSFVRDIADLAEDEGHHPDLCIHGYKHLQVRLSTHAIDGLSDNDFILAAKIERLHDQR